MTKKIAMVSLGCSKNQVDAEIMAGLLEDKAYKIIEDCEDADYIVVNTCGFIEAAKEESIDTILDMAEFKKFGKAKGLIATGCLSERYHEELMESIPELDGIIGTGNYAKIVETIETLEKTGEKVVLYGGIDSPFDETLPRQLPQGTAIAYVKIAEGCDNHCTYCIIPKLRGKYRSRKPENILKEIRHLGDLGVEEIVLIAQDTTMYGCDLEGNWNLSKLLKEVDKIDQVSWIRLMYAYPENIDHDLIETLKHAKRILPYLDIPIQHTEDRILKNMGRRTSKAQILGLFETLRREIPDMVIRTTLIAGFPGETEEEHQEMLKTIKELQADKLGVFDYSREEGTPAGRMRNQIDEETKKARQEAAMDVQLEVSIQRMEKHVGKTMKTLVEEHTEDGFIGRTWMDAPEIDGIVEVSAIQRPPVGTLVDVLITEALEFDLIGVLDYEFAE
ncbi:30S ribosomal protein S12 methylthiotransferase RimO [Alkalibacter rhizosphaerae]|uniref:Ribosomal protein uS12 methylthiotransferase RimO n=1 Tax=Alkalibacter rhizosphaerae TaxID=2815577 RepID=A0A974XEX7_9FIRM|nr:30S ribosomal protein S12 methylthiotransferase RimO [Alkalibacter rhizosphaerae]QSX08609.1 30S ribosomal protein S12 methylthiotransferase RimO [Alkalibacter rhizosphaerae]